MLGSLLIEPKAIIQVSDILRPDHFFAEEHHCIYEAITEIDQAGKTVDLINVTARLEERKQLEDIGGVKYLSDMTRSVARSVNEADVKGYADIIKDRFLHRETITRLTREVESAWEADTGYEAAVKVQATANILSDQAAKPKEFRTMKELGMSAFELLEQRYINSGDEVTGIPSGYADLDRMTSGFQNSDFIIVAARPSVGKTTFALNISQHAAIRANKKVALFSLEMSGEQQTLKMMSAEQLIDANRIRTGFLRPEEWDKAAAALSTLSEANIFVDDSSSITISEIMNKCRRLKNKFGLDMIVIDYLQLISGDRYNPNRQQEVSEISRKLKQLARELDVPVIALSQLSRAVEQRQDKRPVLSDLRESGSIEQDADIVAFLYRDDYYNQESEKKNIIEIIIAKQRNGPVGTVELVFMKDFNKFANYERAHAG
ncbi:Replicative DNA helicase [compost metagenome]